jgi:hypothetical protein
MKSLIKIRLRLRVIPIITIPPLKIMVRGMAKENSRKKRRIVKEIIHLQFVMGKQTHLFLLWKYWPCWKHLQS